MLSSRAAAFSVKALLKPNPDKGKVTNDLQPFGSTEKQQRKKHGRAKSKNHVGEQNLFPEEYNGLTDTTMEWEQQMEMEEEEDHERPPILTYDRHGIEDRIFKDDSDSIFEEEEELLDVENCIETSGPCPIQGINSPPSSPLDAFRHPSGKPASPYRRRCDSSQLSTSDFGTHRFPSASSSTNADWQMYAHASDVIVDKGGGGGGGGGSQGFPSDSSASYRCEGVSIQLLHGDLWTKFNNLKTEMIITKNGRRMFPVVKVGLQGLHPEKSYMVFLDMVAVDDRRYRYVYPSSRWMVAGTGEPLGDHSPYIHPDSPSTGAQWMVVPAVAFDRLKLTNNKTRQTKGQIILHSMQKYQPRVWVQEVDRNATAADLPNLVDFSNAVSATFPETTFITVTAYQNQQITRLKIDSNPFAKGFRDTTKQKELLERRLLPDASAHENASLASMPFMLPLGVPGHHNLPLAAYPTQYAYTCPTSLSQFGLTCPNPPSQYHQDPTSQAPFALTSPVSPPISPAILPHQLYPEALDGAIGGGGGRGRGNRERRRDLQWLPDMSGASFYRSRSMPVLFPQFLPTYAHLPLALDLSKRKEDT